MSFRDSMALDENPQHSSRQNTGAIEGRKDVAALEYFFNAVNDLFAILDKRGAVRRANMAFRRFVGPASGAGDASLLSYLDAESREAALDALEQATVDGPVQRLDLRFQIGRDECLVSAEFTAAPDGGVLFIGRDLTQQQELDRERADIDVNKTALEELAGIGHWRITPDYESEWSPGLYRIHGLDPSQPPPQLDAFLEMIDPEDRDRVRDLMLFGFRDGAEMSCTYRSTNADGQQIIVEMAGSPSQDAFGRITAMQGVAVDKTGSAKALQEALETQSSVRGFMEASPMAVAMFDRDMRFLMVSDLWLEEGGWARDDLIGRRSIEVTPWLPEVWREAHRKSLTGELCYADAEKVELPKNRTAWIRWSSTAWRDASGAIAGTIFTKKDVTDL
ncbi:MAG: PAS domain-containing protein, partial [Pseudomonadota bacterium]